MIAHSKPDISLEEAEAVREQLLSGMIAEGERVREFERAVAAYLGLTGGIATSSGTTALYLALRALNIGAGHEVIVPTYVCRSVMDAVLWAGATPVICDVSQDGCVNYDTIKPHVGKYTKAIVVVHIFGIAAEMAPIAKFGLPIIEDCAQAFGAASNEKMLGSFGVFCICSFNGVKLLSTGEGGMLLCRDKSWLERVREVMGSREDLQNSNYRFPMSDIQASLGLSQLRRYPSFLKRRRQIADCYFTNLRDLPIQLPDLIRNKSIFFRFPLRIPGMDFDRARAAFDCQGVQVRRGVDALLHRIVGLGRDDFKNAESLYAETLSIPIYPALHDSMTEQVIEGCYRILS